MKLDDSLFRFARMRARQLAGRYGFAVDEDDDLFQELAFELLRRLPRHDLQRSSVGTFGRLIINNHVAVLIEAKKTKMRDYTRSQSISKDSDELQPGKLSFGAEPHHLQSDFARVFSRMRPDLAHVCRLVMAGGVTYAAKATGLSRATLYRRLSEIRDVFEAAGLRRYVSGSIRPGLTRTQKRTNEISDSEALAWLSAD